MPVLSIITVNLNNDPGLRKTMESVLHQDYTGFEYIVVDGGSEDGSIQTIKQIENSFAINFQWIAESDSGVYEAMNKGIRMASGKYLLFLNSGDFLVDEKVLEKVFSISHSADFLLGRCNISENGKIIRTTNPPQKITFGYLYNNALAHQATFIKRMMFEKYGFYREDFRYNADVEFWYRTIIFNCCPTESIPLIISDYNTGGISIKEKESDRYKNEMEEIYSNPFLQPFIPDYNVWNKERREMKAMFWARSKPMLNTMIVSVYNSARWFSNLMK